jgi:hypothetical protein
VLLPELVFQLAVRRVQRDRGNAASTSTPHPETPTPRGRYAHGQQPVTALSAFAFSAVLTLLFGGVSLAETVQTGRLPLWPWADLLPLLLFVFFAVLTGVQFRWWCWLRARGGRHRRL